MAKVEIKKDRCKGCELCIVHCPTKHLKLSKELNKRGVKFVETVDGTKCVGCGICFMMCPDCCIEVYK